MNSVLSLASRVERRDASDSRVAALMLSFPRAVRRRWPLTGRQGPRRGSVAQSVVEMVAGG